MLLDFPFYKTKLRAELIKTIHSAQLKQSGIINKVPRSKIFEGNRSTLIRADGTKEESSFEKMSSSTSFSSEELENMTLHDLIELISKMLSSIFSQQTDLLLDKVRKASENSGNVTDAEGQKLSPDLFLKGLEKIWIDFREDGTPELPTLIAGPKLAEQFQKVMQQIQESPKLQKRYSDLIELKRGEWNARESNRKLVD